MFTQDIFSAAIRVIGVSLIIIGLHSSSFSQCNKDYWMDYGAPCEDPDSLPILCDLDILDGTCLSTYDGFATEFDTDLELECGYITEDRISLTTSFIPSQDVAEISFDVLNCDAWGSTTPYGIHVGVFDITSGYCSPPAVATDCNCTMEGGSTVLDFNTVPGRHYMIEVLMCGSNWCDIDISVLQGGGELTADAPSAIMPQASFYSTPDSICQGAMDIPFVLEPPSLQNPRYLLYIDGVFSKEFTSSPVLTDWDVPLGTYDVCVAAANPCDTSLQVCTEVEVVAWPDEYFTDTTCITDFPYTFLGENISSGGEHRIPQETPEGCEYDAVLTLTVEDEPDPLTIDTILCSGNSVTIAGQTFTSTGSYDVSYPSSYGACDTAVTVNVDLIEVSIEYGTVSCGAGIYAVDADVSTFPAAGFLLEYRWYDENGTLVFLGNPLETMTAGTYTVEVVLDYGQQSCTFTGPSLTIEASDFLPAAGDLSDIEDTICTGTEIWWESPETDNTEDYLWSGSPEVEILQGSDSTAVLLTSEVPGIYSMCLETSNACGDSTVCRELTVIEAPSLFVGNDTTICGFETRLTAMGSTGNWTQSSGPGTSTFSDSTQRETTVAVDQPGTYEYTFTTTESLCPISDTIAVTFADTLAIGSIRYECLQGQEFIATVEIEGGTPPFTLLNGSGSIDTSVFTSVSIPSGDTIFLEVSDSEGCGPLTVMLTRQCDCGTDAGMMASDTLQTCDTSSCFSATPIDDPTLDSDDIIQYALHEGSGNSLVNVITIRDDSTFCFRSGMNTGEIYYISRIVGSDDGSGAIDLNDGCLSVAPGQPVIWLAPPAVEITEENIRSCDLSFELEGNTITGNSMWSRISGPAMASIDNQTADTTSVSVSQSGQYCFALQSTVLNCTTADTVCVTVLEELSVDSLEIGCTADNADYSVEFTITGGDTTNYTVTGDPGTFSGNSFSSDLIPSGTQYSFTIQNTCDTIMLEGTHTCDCDSDAGMMSSDTVSVCGNGIITASEAQNIQLDGNDVLIYVLHNGNPLLPIAENTSSDFGFQPPATQYGSVYYISAVVGNDDGSGGVDTADVCLDVSNGRPVVWHEKPEIQLTATRDTLTCRDSTSVLSIQSPQPRYSYQWSSIPSGLPMSTPMRPQTEVSSAGIYQLIVRDSRSGCGDTATIEIFQDPSVPVAEATTGSILTCRDTILQLDGTGSSTGSRYIYQWSPTQGVMDSQSLMPTVSEAGTYTLRVTDTIRNCSATSTVEVGIDTTSPIAIATVDGMFNCETDAVTIDGSGSSVGSEFVYSWTPTEGMTEENTLQPTVTLPGMYTLEVMNTQNGCRAEAVVEVTADTTRIDSFEIQIQQPDCLDSVGGIAVENVSGGTLPYRYILNDGELENETGIFDNLGPGSNKITVIDANGCQAVKGNIILRKPQGLEIQIIPQITIAGGEQAILIPSFIPPGVQLEEIVWLTEGGDTIPCDADCDSLSVSLEQTTTFHILATDSEGCTARASVTVIVEKNQRMYIPNAFSPNGDGINDAWRIYPGAENAQIRSVRIYNKWGDQMYEAFDVSAADAVWDGRFNGELLGPGVFTYQLVVEFVGGEQIFRNGNITLLK